MILLSQELPLSISLNQDTYRNAAQFARAGFEAAECCLPDGVLPYPSYEKLLFTV